MLYREWLDGWLKVKESRIKQSSFSNYKVNVETHIIPLLGDKDIEEIDEDLLQDVLDYLERSGNRKTGQSLSEKTIKELVRLMKATITAYCKKAKITAPYFSDLEYAKGNGSAHDAFTNDEQRKLLSSILKSRNPKAVGVGLGLLEGMRIGEICALKWDNIDMKEQIISVEGTLQRIYRNEEGFEQKSQIIIDSPKTENSRRLIPFGSTVLFMLRSIMPEDWEGKYVLSESEKPMEPRVLRSFYYRMLNENGLRKLKFHSLRHTFGTKSITCGVDPATLCKIMGHANPSITIRLYCHPGMEAMKDAMKSLDSAWLRGREKDECKGVLEDLLK